MSDFKSLFFSGIDLKLFNFQIQGVSPLSMQSKSRNTQICVITHDNQIEFYYFENINFHLISNDNNVNQICKFSFD